MKRKIICLLILLSIFICNIQVTFAVNMQKSNNSTSYYLNDIDVNNIKNSTNSTYTPKVDASKKIYDYANLLSDDEEKELFNKIENFIDEYNMDLVIVTINDNNKSSSMAYADDFYDYNDFGIGDKNDGILFLIDMDYRKMWISTTGNAINIYDSYIDSILDDCYSYITNKNYYKCAITFINSSVDSYEKYVDLYEKHKRFKWIFGFVLACIVSLIIPTVFCLYKKSKHKAIKLATDADTYLIKSSFHLTKSEDKFSHSHTSKIHKSTSSGSGSGSGGTHIGSSGVSHGGGGRSF